MVLVIEMNVGELFRALQRPASDRLDFGTCAVERTIASDFGKSILRRVKWIQR